ncbi:hypothetical protein BV25DRAFT_1902836 [Artomyces pyxidatus]|uniref:Uncharacterized protein n=1 Tax=Artomyces pyxidatus TaxID=48021 RepID=A0ACB8SLB0_9AGAM|nr:hypothetical protein BV25DRAFT_1902836 [Artomyces pyxidatus]
MNDIVDSLCSSRPTEESRLLCATDGDDVGRRFGETTRRQDAWTPGGETMQAPCGAKVGHEHDILRAHTGQQDDNKVLEGYDNAAAPSFTCVRIEYAEVWVNVRHDEGSRRVRLDDSVDKMFEIVGILGTECVSNATERHASSQEFRKPSNATEDRQGRQTTLRTKDKGPWKLCVETSAPGYRRREIRGNLRILVRTEAAVASAPPTYDDLKKNFNKSMNRAHH